MTSDLNRCSLYFYFCFFRHKEQRDDSEGSSNRKEMSGRGNKAVDYESNE